MRKETFWEKIKYAYWSVIPYEYRPGQLWYRLKCWAWHRYSTVRPRYLPNTWCDRTDILPHAMFEILSQFIERENPYPQKEYSEHMIDVDGENKLVADEMRDLYDWWNNVYQTEYQAVRDILYREADSVECKHSDEEIEVDGRVLYEWKQDFPTGQDREIYQRCLFAYSKCERQQRADLTARMHRLVNLMPYMWT